MPIKRILVIYVTAVTLLISEALASSGAQVQCSTIGQKPTFKQCMFQLKIANKTVAYDEEFVLSLNDPIEYFHYRSIYKAFADEDDKHGVFVRLPVLGAIRDQFVDTDPFNSTLLFTFSVFGFGYFLDLPYVQLNFDSSLIYVKQRYAPPFVHSTEDSDPENNRIYHFEQFASATRIEVIAGHSGPITAKSAYEYRLLRAQSRLLSYREFNALLMWRLAELTNFSFGLSSSYYLRHSEFRRDRNVDSFERTRVGVYLELL